MKLPLLIFIMSTCVLTACSSINKPEEFVWLEPSMKTLMPNASCPYDYEKDELLTWQAQGKTQSLRVQTSCKGEVLDILGMVPSGPRVFTAKKEGRKVEVVSTFSKELPISATQIAWNILFATLQKPQLMKSIPNGYYVEDGIDVRKLINPQGTVILEAKYSNGLPVVVRSEIFHYSIKIRNLD